MNQHTYHIYGRKAYANPLKFVGELTIPAEEALESVALQQFGAEAWVELVALPKADILTIIAKTSAA